MLPERAPPGFGTFRMLSDAPLTCGTKVLLRFQFDVGSIGMRAGGKLRIGLPNTGWEVPVVPQQRYWDELVCGPDRKLAPFHPVNTTARIRSESPAAHTLEAMERMLVADEDPAVAYWRWWITLTLEAADLKSGDQIEILYGDNRFGSSGAQVQSFPEPGINVSAYLQPSADKSFVELEGSPQFLDVISGPPVRANVVLPSVLDGDIAGVRISITDQCHAIPAGESQVLFVDEQPVNCQPGKASVATVRLGAVTAARIVKARGAAGEIWGASNPAVARGGDGLGLFFGDLHAQSEHHVMHSQRKDFRQAGWSKGISCGTLDECYRYAREVSLLDFVAITDQGACLTDRWEFCQEKVRAYHQNGRFVVFKGYEAGAPIGHRNVIYGSDEVDPPLDPAKFGNFAPRVLFDHYHGREDVLIIPHHVKTWTDWDFHDPELEPLMEVYSCWGQSEAAGKDLWNKAQTPGAGAWEALRRGYRLGMIASSDNHVGMPGRSYPGDRQVHTPFAGGLCAVWAEALTRPSLFAALKARRCYGTTGSRIILRFSIDGHPMGSIIPAHAAASTLSVEVHGTNPIDRVELVHNLELVQTFVPREAGAVSLSETRPISTGPVGFYYVRVFQKDNERAWSSPIWIEG